MIQDSTYEKLLGYCSCSEWGEGLIGRVDDTDCLSVFGEKAFISAPPTVQIYKDEWKRLKLKQGTATFEACNWVRQVYGT